MTAHPEFPLVVVHPIDSDIRLIQLAPGVDASVEPLLKHAGLACELGGRIEVAMTGITGTSELIRQFLTTAGNDLTEEVLTVLAKELNSPARRFGVPPAMRTRSRTGTRRRSPDFPDPAGRARRSANREGRTFRLPTLTCSRLSRAAHMMRGDPAPGLVSSGSQHGSGGPDLRKSETRSLFAHSLG